MKFSYNWLKELAPLKDSAEGLAEFLTMRVFEVEGVEQYGDDWVIDISGKTIGPRMADASGHWGLAREIALLKNLKVNIPQYARSRNSRSPAKKSLQVGIENSSDCPRYTARVIECVRIGESPREVKERLAVCGVQSINNVVDAANYVMLETGQPLHIFDFEKLKSKDPESKTITVRRAKSGETLRTLDDKIYELNPEILVIADEEGLIAIAGIKGGKASGVSRETTTIVLESANFDPVLIHRASRLLGLRTDASYRFEHGLDPGETVTAIDRLDALIQEFSGGAAAGATADAYSKKAVPRHILFHGEYANELIGDALPVSFYKDVFSRIGCALQSKGKSMFLVTPPAIRRDLKIEEDLIEEAARVRGYERIAPRIPEVMLIPAARNENLFWEERIRDALLGAGFSEAQLYEFTGDGELDQFSLSREDLVALENPASADTKYLVPRLLIKYVAAAGENLRHFNEARLFGIGKSFLSSGEREEIVAVYADKEGHDEDGFYELKGTIDALLESMGISEHWYDDEISNQLRGAGYQLFHPHRIADIRIGDEKIGIIGEIHPKIAENLKARGRITAAEIEFEKLVRLAAAESEYRPIGKYPAVIRDIAVVVRFRTKTEEVQNVIENLGGSLLVDADIFDYFQDETMREAEEKSLAFHLVFQSPERTLIDAEIEVIIKKIIAALEEKGWEVRK